MRVTEKRFKLTIVVPVYNNAESLSELTSGLVQICEQLVSKSRFEILFIDDASTDNSSGVIDELIVQFPKNKIRKIALTKNYGQVAALFAGYSNLESDCCITISADLQDPIEKIPEMYNAFLSGVELVVCFRDSREESFFHKTASWITYRFARMKFPELPPGGFDYFLMGSEVTRELVDYQIRAKFLQGAILGLGYTPLWIPYTRRKRPYGKSQWTLKKKLKLFWAILISESFIPIRFFTVIGGITFLLSSLLCGVIAVRKLYGNSVFEGFPTLVFVITLFGGAIIMSLGIISEYIIRIIENQQKLPVFRIKGKS
jgi:glycosyltransferase involved in cell wall biosynthesis